MALVKVKILKTRVGDGRRKYKAGDVTMMEEAKARWVDWVEILPTPAEPKKKTSSAAAETRKTAARETKSGSPAPRKRKSTKRKRSPKSKGKK